MACLRQTLASATSEMLYRLAKLDIDSVQTSLYRVFAVNDCRFHITKRIRVSGGNSITAYRPNFRRRGRWENSHGFTPFLRAPSDVLIFLLGFVAA
jgi:hypothetical protein